MAFWLFKFDPDRYRLAERLADPNPVLTWLVSRYRDDIRPGLRVIGFERRATIVFQVTENEVVIVRIFYGGQDYERALRRDGVD